MNELTTALSSPLARGTATARKPAPITTDFDFNLGVAKAKVLKAIDEQITGQFRKFFTGPLFDRMLQTLLLYFTAVFQLEWVIAAMERSRKQHIEGYNPYVVAARIHDLEAEIASLRMELSPLYSQVILQHSTYEKPQQDRKFFEGMYDALIAILDDAFDRLKRRADIERDMGLLFRSKHFNLYKRKNQPLRSVDTLSVKELYALKHETSNRALNARTLASLFEKPPSLGVTVAAVTNSPLISQYITSPIVARSMMKDPEVRDNLLATGPPGSRGTGRLSRDAKPRSPEGIHAPGPDLSIGGVFRSAAMLKGVDPSKLQAQLGNMKLKPQDAADIGVLGPDKAKKGDHVRPPAGAVAPEAAGLPVDETYNYLALMKRYVIYGPSLGMTNGVANPGQVLGPLTAVPPAAGLPTVFKAS